PMWSSRSTSCCRGCRSPCCGRWTEPPTRNRRAAVTLTPVSVPSLPRAGRTSTLTGMNNAPIGILDSGVGGLTVARAVLDQLPQEELVYIGDTAHSPYGPRPIANVRELVLQVLDSLVARDVKMLVIACNTASAAVLRDARERYEVPVVEVIQPAVRRAVAATRNHRVGVIG